MTMPTAEDNINAGESFEAIYARNKDRLLAMAIRRTRSVETAEDIVQQTFQKFCQFSKRDNPLEKPDHWLSRTCLNLCIDQHRTKAKSPLQSADDPFATLTSNEPTPYEAAEKSDFAAHVLKKVQSLPALDAKVVVARVVNQEDVGAIAQREGCTPKAVACRVTRAILRLRDILKSDPTFKDFFPPKDL